MKPVMAGASCDLLALCLPAAPRWMDIRRWFAYALQISSLSTCIGSTVGNYRFIAELHSVTK